MPFPFPCRFLVAVILFNWTEYASIWMEANKEFVLLNTTIFEAVKVVRWLVVLKESIM